MEWFTAIAVLAGAIVVFIGSLGLVRLPDFFSRMHAAGPIDTLGAWLILAGLLAASPSIVVAFKVFLMAALLYMLSPVISHALAQSAMDDEIEDVEGAEEGRQL